jgi:hypothetical protein
LITAIATTLGACAAEIPAGGEEADSRADFADEATLDDVLLEEDAELEPDAPRGDLVGSDPDGAMGAS